MTAEAAGIIVAAIGSMGALAQSWRTARVAEIIHVAVNSNLSEVKADLAVANRRIEELLVLLTKEQERGNGDA